MIACYAPQRIAVMELIHHVGGTMSALKMVYEPDQLRGLRGGMFVEIVGHPHPLPQGLRQVLQSYGWIMVRVDDVHARQLHARQLV